MGEPTNRLVVSDPLVLRYAITDIHGQGLDQPAAREAHLRGLVRAWAVDGVNIVQLREKQLESGELFRLAQVALEELKATSPSTVVRQRPLLLLNSRPDIAVAAGADGVHLTARPGELTPTQVRTLFQAAKRPHCLISVSCHTLEEVGAARAAQADLILFGPVFEKTVAGERMRDGTGLLALQAACRAARPVLVLALGGITPTNLASCLEAGATGFAGIRSFAKAPGLYL